LRLISEKKENLVKIFKERDWKDLDFDEEEEALVPDYVPWNIIGNLGFGHNIQ
jgi:hypothetical protein